MKSHPRWNICKLSQNEITVTQISYNNKKITKLDTYMHVGNDVLLICVQFCLINDKIIQQIFIEHLLGVRCCVITGDSRGGKVQGSINGWEWRALTETQYGDQQTTWTGAPRGASKVVPQEGSICAENWKSPKQSGKTPPGRVGHVLDEDFLSSWG